MYSPFKGILSVTILSVTIPSATTKIWLAFPRLAGFFLPLLLPDLATYLTGVLPRPTRIHVIQPERVKV